MQTGFDLLGALPLELSLQCLAQLPCRERHSVVPLVSKHWRGLSRIPALQRQLVVGLRPADVLPALHSLSAGLLRSAAGHTESFHLAVDASHGYLRGPSLSDAAAAAAVAQAAEGATMGDEGVDAVLDALAGCLAAFAGPGPRSLSRLVLDLSYIPLSLAEPWATAALRGVRQLSISAHGAPLCVSAPLQELGSLAKLSLEGAPLALGGAVRLPAGLTKLHLGGVEGAGILGKVAEATALRCVSLAHMEQSAEELSVLASLGPSLQRLALTWCRHLPAPTALSQLARLRALHIDRTPRGHAQEVFAELQAALEPLTQLTHLVCAHLRVLASMPPAIAELAELQSFGWHGPAPTASPALPDGPWVHSLCTLSVPAEVAAASLPLLASATRLEGLGLYRFTANGCARQYDILRAAAAHPALRRVCMRLDEATLQVGLFDAAMEAQRRKPGLRIERSNSIAKALEWHDLEAA